MMLTYFLCLLSSLAPPTHSSTHSSPTRPVPSPRPYLRVDIMRDTTPRVR